LQRLGDRGIDLVHHCRLERDELCQHGDPIGIHFASVEQSRLEDRRAQGKLILVGQHMVVAQDKHSLAILGERSERAGHAERVIGCAEPD